MTKMLQLAKGYEPKKLPAVVLVSEKLDGVPIRVDLRVTDSAVTIEQAVTRQGEHSYSTTFIQQHLAALLIGKLQGTFTFVGEVTHEDYTDFKDVSGVVRRQTPQSGLIYNIFDFWDAARPEDGFGKRIFACMLLLGQQRHDIRIVPQKYVNTVDIEKHFAEHLPAGAEGGVVRDPDEKWLPGKRTWGYQKYVQDPTIDLRLHSVEEAKSEAGVPLGMVGRLNFWYKGKSIGVGPGKLSHAERTALWEEWTKTTRYYLNWMEGKGPMACIQYKRDASYDALRQPTFQHWRDDKDEADA